MQQPHNVSNAAARHAEVVPSFVMQWIHRPLTSWVGPVEPHELLRWERPGDLTSSAREELRNQIVKRLRDKSDIVWSTPVGVRLVEGWDAKLLAAERKAIAIPFLHGGKALHEATLAEVKTALKVPLEKLFSVLARIEAVYWVPPTVSTAAREVLERLPDGVPVNVDEALKVLAAQVLAQTWVSAVRPEDIRFGFPGTGSVAEWISQQVALPRASGRLPSVLQALKEAESLTAAEEARALVQAASRQCLAKRPGEGSTARWVEMVLARHITAKGPGRTLKDAGALFNVTRERIRQVCEAIELVLRESPSATPALDRVLRATTRVAPLGIDEADEQLARFIGPGAGIEALIAWAEVLGRDDVPVRCGRAKLMLRGSLMNVRMVLLRGDAEWMAAALKHASRDCSVIGCSNLIRVAGQLALKEGVAPGQEALESVLGDAEGFRWLDTDSGWFTLGETTNSAAATRVRKIMAVAQDTVGSDEIAAALASDDLWLYREEKRAFAIPPPHVLRELFLGWDFLQVVQKGRFQGRETVSLDAVLSASEQMSVRTIEATGGVACRFELKEAIMTGLGVTDMAVSTMLGSSPVIVKLEHGLYALRGRRVADAALDSARARLRARSNNGISLPGLGSDEYALRVTEASLRNEQYTIPARYQESFLGRPVKVCDEQGLELGTARANKSGALAGLNRLLPGLQAGDLIIVQVHGEVLRVRVVRGAAAAAEDAAAEDAESNDGTVLGHRGPPSERTSFEQDEVRHPSLLAASGLGASPGV